ncbi:MAG: hypothetical protein HRT37_14220 [Alteromonadaceae bacterium]|nr:hypothetical protein [Alteromonadaceae bacterium]
MLNTNGNGNGNINRKTNSLNKKKLTNRKASRRASIKTDEQTNKTAHSATSKVNIEYHSHNWLDIRNIKDQHQLAQQYTTICQQHEQDNKWILMINPEDKSLETLYASGKINTTKILRVNAKRQTININNIATALKTGNCSAVILCNASIKEEEIHQLSAFAQKGKTQCIVLKTTTTLH